LENDLTIFISDLDVQENVSTIIGETDNRLPIDYKWEECLTVLQTGIC